MFNALTTRELRSELDKLSRIYGHAEVRVIHAGNGAKTDGKTIWLPPMPEGAVITEEEMRIFRGYQIHEVAHVRYTDMDYWKEKNEALKDRLLQHVWNLFEDIFIERRTCEEFAGALKSLEETNDAVMKMGVEKGLENNPWYMAAAYQVAVECRFKLGYMSSYRQAFLDNAVKDERGRDLIDKYVPKAMKTKSTRTTFKLAQEFVAEVREHLKEEKEEERKKNPPKRGNGSSGSTQTQGEWAGFVKVKREGHHWPGMVPLKEQIMRAGGYNIAEAERLARAIFNGEEVEIAVRSDFTLNMATINPSAVEDAVKQFGGMSGLVASIAGNGKGEGDDGDDQDEGDGEGEGSGAAGDEDDSEDDGKGNNSSGDEGDGEGEASGEANDGSEDDDAIREETDNAVKEDNLNATAVLNQIAKGKSDGRGDYFVLDDTHDRFVPEGDPFFRSVATLPTHYEAIRNKATAELGALSNKLRRALLAQKREFVEGGKKRGRLDRRKLAQVVTGNDRVFCEKVNEQAKNTVVTIAVDLSGSMYELEEATILALAIMGESLERAEVDFEIVGWAAGPLDFDRHTERSAEILGCANNDDAVVMEKTRQRKLFRDSSIEPLMLIEMKGIRSPMRKRKGLIGGFGSLVTTAFSCTPTVCALRRLGERMAGFGDKYERKVLLFLTDGLPHLNDDPFAAWKNEVYVREAKLMVDKVKKSGIEVHGVGIGKNVGHLERYMPGCVKLTSDELARGLLEQLDKVLIKK